MRRALVPAVGALVLAGVSTVVPAGASGAVDTPVVLTSVVPGVERWEPRVADVLGAGWTGVLYVRERDPGLFDNDGGAQFLWRPYGAGDEVSLEFGTGDEVLVRGDRVISVDDAWPPPVEITVRSMPDPQPMPVTVPEGYRYVTATGDGLLLRSDTVDDHGLYLMSWDDGTVGPIAGFPTSDGTGYAASGQGTSDARGAIVMADGPGGTVLPHYVDTAAARAWPIPAAGMNTGGWSLGGDTIAWWQDPANEWTTPQVIATTPRPSMADASPAAPSTRPMPTAMADNPFDWSMRPFGDDVLVWRQLEMQQYERALEYPILAVAPTGAIRSFVAWGHGAEVAPAGDRVLAVARSRPADAAIVQVTTGGAQTPLVALPPVPARAGAVALDGTRLVVADDSGPAGAVVNRTMTRTGTTLTVGDGRPLTTGVQGSSCGHSIRCATVTAGDGATMFLRGNYPRAPRWVAFQGGAQVSDPETIGPHGTVLVAADGRWGLATDVLGGRDYLLDAKAGTVTRLDAQGHDVTGGVLFGPASASTPLAVTTRTLATGTVGTITVPAACGVAWTVQAAGRWLLVDCDGKKLAMDRRGVIPPWWITATDGSYWLGDGFLARAMPVWDGGIQYPETLEWVDLYDAGHTWRALGTRTVAAGSVAVDRTGTGQLVAWVDPQSAVRVAALPVRSTDTIPPTVSLNGPTAAVTTAGSSRISWTGSDLSGVATYSLRYRVGHRGRALGPHVYPSAYQRTTHTNVTLPLLGGRTYCYSVLAADKAKNQSAWTAERCTSTPVDDRALTRSTRAIDRGIGRRHYADTYSRMSSANHRLTVGSVSARRVTLVASTCATCGAVNVYLGARKLGRVSLYSAANRYQVLKSLPATSLRSGTLSIRGTSSKRVHVDGVVLRR